MLHYLYDLPVSEPPVQPSKGGQREAIQQSLAGKYGSWVPDSYFTLVSGEWLIQGKTPETWAAQAWGNQ